MTVTDGDLQFVDTGEQCGKARRVCQKDAVPHILAKLLRASHFANGGEANQLRPPEINGECCAEFVMMTFFADGHR
jgi:hypothetical protein